MAEFLTDGAYAQTTEHDYKRVIAGDVESVRERLTKQLPPAHVPHALSAALPPHASVTEGTTERLVTPERPRVAVPLKPHKTDTAEI
ncbi:MAG TPA: hypothetical protein VGC87_17105 [Pyrinomonadaceae bacterium]|jgi:hypothetical protein